MAEIQFTQCNLDNPNGYAGQGTEPVFAVAMEECTVHATAKTEVVPKFQELPLEQQEIFKEALERAGHDLKALFSQADSDMAI